VNTRQRYRVRDGQALVAAAGLGACLGFCWGAWAATLVNQNKIDSC